MSRRLLVVLLVCASLVRIAASDEDPAVHQQRLANIASEEKRGHKPWSVDYSLSVDDTSEATSGPNRTKTHSKDTVHGTGGGRMTFFVESDATEHNFRIDANGALWKDSNGKGSRTSSSVVSTIDSICQKWATTTTDSSAPDMTCGPFFEIDDEQKIWRFSAGCDGTSTVRTKRESLSSPPACGTRTDTSSDTSQDHIGGECTNSDAGARLSRDKNGFTIDCTLRTSHANESTPDEKISGERVVTLHARIAFKPTVELYASLEPASDDVYKTWRPQGPVLDGGSVKGKDGNKLAVNLVLRDAATNQPVNTPYDATVTVDSSRVPGVAMNYPPLASASDEPDLYFRKDDNTGKPAGKDGLMLTFSKVRGTTKLSVTSRDWGGYAILGAVVNVDGKQVPVKARALGKDVDTFVIPRDDDHNHIADAWEDDKGILAKELPATWDAENQPAMHSEGDGYSLYDEYRGFYLQHLASGKVSNRGARATHVELSPVRRDLLVAIAPGKFEALGYAGANTLGGLESLDISFVSDPKYLGPLKGDLDARHPRQANFNRSIRDKLDDEQAAVWVVFDDKLAGDAGVTPFVPGVPVEAFGSPMFVKAALIGPDHCKAEVGNQVDWGLMQVDPRYGSAKAQRIQAAFTKRGLSADAFARKAKERTQADTLELIEFSVVHELGHSIGARHHELDMYLKCTPPAKQGCSNEASCSGCPIYSDTSKRSMACSVAEEVNGNTKRLLTAAETEPFLHDRAFGAAHNWYCYDGYAEHFGGGDAACPMRYWQMLDGEAMVKWLLGEWNPAKGAPDGGAWHFCGENAPTLRLHQTSAELLRP